MHCVNTACAKPLDDDVKFCPYCRTKQPEINASADESLSGSSGTILGASANAGRAALEASLRNAEPDSDDNADSLKPSTQSRPVINTEQPDAVSPSATARKTPVAVNRQPVRAPEPGLIMRASDNIWDFEEPEGYMQPGVRRPLLIVDEQCTHLAHTDNRLTPEELLKRTQEIVAVQQVPVQVNIVNSCWSRDQQECRPRLVAYLADRPRSDVKMVFGVDYLGKWASINMMVGIEPDPLPAPPTNKSFMPSGTSIAIAVVGFVLTITIIGAIIGIPLLLFAGWMMWNDYQAHLKKLAQNINNTKEQYRQQQIEKLFRTFRVDDTRLFTAAMSVVYKAVVDDIVSRGGEVVRVSGGRGGFIDNEGIASAVPARGSDAADADV